MNEHDKLELCSTESRKALLEKQNRLIQKKWRTPEASLLGSSLFSYDISLNSLSLKTESEDLKESTLQNFSSRSKKPSEVLYECINSNISEKDQKILRLMAARREAKMEEDQLALSAKNVWEEERIQQQKRAERRKKALLEYLAKKKRMEELETSLRKRDRNENLKQEKMRLELQISEKHERVERRQKELSRQKMLKPDVLTTKYQLLLHQELKKQKEREEEMEKALHAQTFEAKEKRSEEKLERLLIERCRRMREESLKRQLKWEAAKNLREELNRKQEKEKLQNLRDYERNQEIREERVKWTTEWRRKIVLEKNRREKQKHALIYNKIMEEEEERANRTRRKIQDKDWKMKVLRERREEAISRSRFNASSSANLRQKIRLTYQL